MAASGLNVERRSASRRETEAMGRRLGSRLRGRDVIAISGPLGAGKTCFVRGLAAGLGVPRDAVSSPTFVLCQLYEGRTLQLAHLDAFRIASAEELATIGWEELLADDRMVVVVEWAERMARALPDRRIDVSLRHVGPRERHISLAAPPELVERLQGLGE